MDSSSFLSPHKKTAATVFLWRKWGAGVPSNKDTHMGSFCFPLRPSNKSGLVFSLVSDREANRRRFLSGDWNLTPLSSEYETWCFWLVPLRVLLLQLPLAWNSRTSNYLPFPFFPGIRLSRKPPETQGKKLVSERNDG